MTFLQERLVSAVGLPLVRVGEVSGDLFFSAVRTCERAATAAALCDPWPEPEVFEAEALFPGDDLNAEDKAAKAEALWVGPPWFEPFDLSWDCNDKEYNHHVNNWRS